ncbi:MAG: hypothetical protein ACKOAR_09870 [Bacteroidota bacterium]
MIRTFTHNDLTRFICHETTAEENTEINHLLELDRELRLEVEGLRATLRQLDGTLLEPSDVAIANIMKHARVAGRD